ncbi:helix-turn-helix transcriptional regulator [Kytococcus sp. Marseille-QA3725]
MAAESATARLERLLAMVPWLLQRQGVGLEEAARTFGVSTASLERDLQLVFMCGLPGRMPDDLIDAQWDHGHVYLRNADTIARPLRLGPDEAIALVAGLHALAGAPGLDREDRERAEELAERIAAAAGPLRPLVEGTVVHEASVPTDEHLAHRLRRAVQDHRLVRIVHVAHGRDRATSREISPMRVVTADGQTYLEGWCHEARDVRLFRLDRIASAEVLEADGTPPAEARPRDLGAGAYTGGPDDTEVVLDLSPEADWVAEYYGATDAAEAGTAGRRRVVVRAADPAWVTRLVWSTGGAVRVVSPEGLVGAVEEGAREAVARLSGADARTVQ